MSATDLVIAALVIFLGSYVQSSIGFGLAIIAAPLLFFVDPLLVPAPITVCALMLSVPNALKHRHTITLSGLKYAIIGRVPGTVAGGLVLLLINQRDLTLFLGACVLIAVAISFSHLRLRPTKVAMLFAGFLSGFMGTGSAIGGPPMALVMQHESGDYIRGNLAAFFIISASMSLLMLFAVGRFGVAELLLSLPLVPAAFAGYWVAMRYLHLVSPDLLRQASLALCTAAGLVAVAGYWR